MPQYLEEALQCGEVVWKWGLLKKGYGLCHGAAGNAYAFLALYRQTQDPKHLFRACMVRSHSSHVVNPFKLERCLNKALFDIFLNAKYDVI